MEEVFLDRVDENSTMGIIPTIQHFSNYNLQDTSWTPAVSVPLNPSSILSVTPEYTKISS